MEIESAVTPAQPDWRALLAAEVAARKDEGGKAAVAKRLGVSRSYVSRALSTGTSAYKDVPQEFIDRVLGRFHRVVCPAIGDQEQPRTECNKANGAAPIHNPLAMRIWRECQQCPNKPVKEVKP